MFGVFPEKRTEQRPKILESAKKFVKLFFMKKKEKKPVKMLFDTPPSFDFKNQNG